MHTHTQIYIRVNRPPNNIHVQCQPHSTQHTQLRPYWERLRVGDVYMLGEIHMATLLLSIYLFLNSQWAKYRGRKITVESLALSIFHSQSKKIVGDETFGQGKMKIARNCAYYIMYTTILQSAIAFRV